jgi:small-conductance mechanosensitive channel
VRFRIDELFRENGIVIAFPQRDVHLDNLQPLQVRVLEDDPD